MSFNNIIIKNMEKDIVALELRNEEIILTIGNYSKDVDKVNIVYKTIRPLSTHFKEGTLIDIQSLTNDIKQILIIDDQKHKIRTTINDIVLVLDPYDLNVWTIHQNHNISSSDSRITKNDISNCLNAIKNRRIPAERYSIVDIVPNQFIVDGNRIFTEPPIGVQSTTLTLNANVFCLPDANFRNILGAVSDAGVKISRVVVSPIGVSQLLKSYKTNFETYVLVDCEKSTTICSFVGSEKVFKSVNNTFGLNDLYDDVCEKFGILHGQAKDLVELYGYDPRPCALNPVIQVSTINGEEKEFHIPDLNEIILKYFQKFKTELDETINEILNEYPDFAEVSKLLFIGEGTKVKGFKEFMMENQGDSIYEFLQLQNVGLLDSVFLNCVGGIYNSSVYQGSLEDNIKSSKIDVSRVEDKKITYKETQDEL